MINFEFKKYNKTLFSKILLLLYITYYLKVHRAHRNYIPDGCSMSIQRAFSSRTLAKQFHDEWVTEVKRHVPAERLLLYSVELGWGPICNFLNLPLPPEAIHFPKSNDTKEIQSGIFKMQIISWTILIFALFAVFVCILILYKCLT